MIHIYLNSRKLKMILCVLVAFFNTSMITINDYNILSEADRDLERIESFGRPALSSALDEEPHWESFNKWMCFSSRSAETYCAEIDYGKSYLPTLRVSDENDKFYELSLDPEPDLNCETTLNQWRDLLANQHGFCVYAAYLQKLGVEHELWIVDTLKSYRGNWSTQTSTTTQDLKFKNFSY